MSDAENSDTQDNASAPIEEASGASGSQSPERVRPYSEAAILTFERGDLLTHLDELKALCRLLIKPEPTTVYAHLAESNTAVSSHERLFMRQQEEQERRRRFLHPSAVRFCPLGTDIRYAIQQPEMIRAVAMQTKINILNKFGITFNATQEHYDDKCVICLQMYVEKDILRKLKCGHIFHQNCIDRWIWKEVSCPICRCTVLRYSDGNASDSNYVERSTSDLVREIVQAQGMSSEWRFATTEEDEDDQQQQQDTASSSN